MSEPAVGTPVDPIFASVMGSLAPDEAPGEAGGSPAPDAGAAGQGDPAPAGVPEPAGEAGEPASAGGGDSASVGEPDPNLGDDAPRVGASAPADTGGDSGAEGDADAEPGGGDRVSAGTVDYTAIVGDLTGLSQKFEETTQQAFRQQAMEAAREEYSNYFSALQSHPRLLVGTEVPALQGAEGEMETLRSSEDAKEWQEAVKSLLTQEVSERAEKSVEENRGIIDTVHAAIEIFTRNKDLVPGTRQFNRQLADRFASMAKPYELRIDGRLHGYTIPVQPLIDQLRTQVVNAQPAPAVAQPEKRGPGRPAGSRNKPPADPPQKGLSSKAGSGSDEEDFSTLFGTLGLPNIRI